MKAMGGGWAVRAVEDCRQADGQMALAVRLSGNTGRVAAPFPRPTSPAAHLYVVLATSPMEIWNAMVASVLQKQAWVEFLQPLHSHTRTGKGGAGGGWLINGPANGH